MFLVRVKERCFFIVDVRQTVITWADHLFVDRIDIGFVVSLEMEASIFFGFSRKASRTSVLSTYRNHIHVHSHVRRLGPLKYDNHNKNNNKKKQSSSPSSLSIAVGSYDYRRFRTERKFASHGNAVLKM